MWGFIAGLIVGAALGAAASYSAARSAVDEAHATCRDVLDLAVREVQQSRANGPQIALLDDDGHAIYQVTINTN